MSRLRYTMRSRPANAKEVSEKGGGIEDDHGGQSKSKKRGPQKRKSSGTKRRCLYEWITFARAPRTKASRETERVHSMDSGLWRG